MKTRKKTNIMSHNNQKGVALLVALVMTITFVLAGVMISKRTKVDTKVAGSNVRYNVVFEAAEQSLRDATFFIQSIRYGEPIAGALNSTGDLNDGRDLVKDFHLSKIENKGTSFVLDPSKSFIWKEGELEDKVCGADGCNAGVNFIDYLDSDIWEDLAIESDLATTAASGDLSNVDTRSYILNTQTHTFIQRIKSGLSEGFEGESGASANSSENYYLITVKASGYQPNQAKDAGNARENVIIQAVFIQKT